MTTLSQPNGATGDSASTAPEKAPEWARLGFVPAQVLRASGMRRSGNHAILSWLQRNAPPRGSVFLNNCKAGTNPLSHFATIEINAKKVYFKSGDDRLAKACKNTTDGALFLFSYEDNSTNEFRRSRNLSGDFDAALITTDLLIYRSFLNWAASLLKKIQANDGYALSRRCAIILRAFDTYTRLLELVLKAKDKSDVVPICYDEWATSQEYRARVLTHLNLPQRDNSLGAVQTYGGGSSFQKDAQTPQDLQTSQRWQQMSDDTEFQAILLLASRDQSLMKQVIAHFPQDAARLAQLSHRISLPQGDGS